MKEILSSLDKIMVLPFGETIVFRCIGKGG